MVEGLFLFLGVVSFSVSSAIFLVSREKEKLETREREKEKANPWLVSAWQKSMHLMAKEEFSPLEGADAVIVESYF